METCKDPSALVSLAHVRASDGRLCVVAVHGRRFSVFCGVLALRFQPQEGCISHPCVDSSVFPRPKPRGRPTFLPLPTRSTPNRTRGVHLPHRGCNCLPHHPGGGRMPELEEGVHLLARGVHATDGVGLAIPTSTTLKGTSARSTASKWRPKEKKRCVEGPWKVGTCWKRRLTNGNAGEGVDACQAVRRIER